MIINDIEKLVAKALADSKHAEDKTRFFQR